MFLYLFLSVSKVVTNRFLLRQLVVTSTESTSDRFNVLELFETCHSQARSFSGKKGKFVKINYQKNVALMLLFTKFNFVWNKSDNGL